MRIQNLYYKLGGKKEVSFKPSGVDYIQKKRLREIESYCRIKEYVLLMLCRQPVKKLVSALEWNLEPCLEPIVIKGLFLMMMIWTLPCGQKTVLGI